MYLFFNIQDKRYVSSIELFHFKNKLIKKFWERNFKKSVNFLIHIEHAYGKFSMKSI